MRTIVHLVLVTATTALRVVIIGAGVSGLRCSKRLLQSNSIDDVTVLESSNVVGGRVRTETIEGYQLDIGFAVFLAAYPEARESLDYEALHLREFVPGAIVQSESGASLVADPTRRPSTLLASLAFPLASLAEKFRLGVLVLSLRLQSIDAILASADEEEECSTLDYLRERLVLSEALIDGFFRPFLEGIYLAPLEQQSPRLLRFVLKMFAEGAVTLPMGGMGSVAAQLEKGVTDSGGTVRLNSAVDSVSFGVDGAPHSVQLASGESLEYDRVIVATTRAEACRLLAPHAQRLSPEWLAPGADTHRTPLCSACMYFALNGPPPVREPILVLNGGRSDGGGTSRVVNTICFPSLVSPSYAPPGQHLASVSLVGPPVADALGDDGALSETAREALEEAVRSELSKWYGADELASWRHLRTYALRCAQEGRPPPNRDGFDRSARVGAGVYACGDHLATPSLNGALRSGRVAAEALLDDLGLDGR